MVVFTCIDGALRASDTGDCIASRTALASLTARNVPVILTSHHRADELIALQHDLQLREPFIAGGGAQLYLPNGYFDRSRQLGQPQGDWSVIDFTPPSVADAVSMLAWLYGGTEEPLLLVGVGTDLAHCDLLRHVDVPVVIRNPLIDQDEIRRQIPDAYITASAGPRGWTEAILGSV